MIRSRYKRSLQEANERPSGPAVLPAAVLEGRLGAPDRGVRRRDVADIPDRQALPRGMDESVSLHQGAGSARDTLHADRHAVPHDRRVTEGAHRTRARVSPFALTPLPCIARGYRATALRSHRAGRKSVRVKSKRVCRGGAHNERSPCVAAGFRVDTPELLAGRGAVRAIDK